PYIYEYDGVSIIHAENPGNVAIPTPPQTPIFSGFGHAGGQNSHNLKLVELNGQPHLTFFNGVDELDGNRGNDIIMDNTYHTVATVQSGNGWAANDVYEFTVLPDGTAIATIFESVQYNLSRYGVDQLVGWVVEGIV
ncbi:hypothetical protein K432DRAFT_470949, partial [Lepidopterella palustris CBS 459.81]